MYSYNFFILQRQKVGTMNWMKSKIAHQWKMEYHSNWKLDTDLRGRSSYQLSVVNLNCILKISVSLFPKMVFQVYITYNNSVMLQMWLRYVIGWDGFPLCLYVVISLQWLDRIWWKFHAMAKSPLDSKYDVWIDVEHPKPR